MKQYFIRLDDACEKRDISKWNRMEALLDKHQIKPLVGVIPDCKDPDMECYNRDDKFWQRVHLWQDKGWIIAMHGYNHVFTTKCGGINPVNKYSEFAGVALDKQKEMIALGIDVFHSHGIEPKVFFAPAHTFDENTLEALRKKSNIRFISDTPANKPYCKYCITFVPQQSGMVRELPFNTVTFCYHPNKMCDSDFEKLEQFIQHHKFSEFLTDETRRKISLFDKLIMGLYYWRHRR